MPLSKLIELSYFDGGSKIRLTAYADTVILENGGDDSTITAIRFGGYPEMVRAMSDAIYGGGTVEAVRNDVKRTLKSRPKGYRRQLAHDGVYATATLMANDDKITAEPENDDGDDDGGQGQQQELQPRKCYIFCPAGDRDRLFEEVDRKTAAPLIPEFRDYVLDGLTARGDLRQLEVVSLREKLDAFARARTLKQAKNIMIEAVKNDFVKRFGDETGENMNLFIAYTKDRETALEFKAQVQEAFPDGDIQMADPLSLSVACHIGPGALALACARKLSSD